MANTYCVTFRIADKTIGGKSYSDRRNALIDNVKTEGLGYWEETTSFILTESNLDTFGFGAKVCKGLSAKDDILVVFDPGDMSLAYFGPIASLDVLKSFFGDAQKVP